MTALYLITLTGKPVTIFVEASILSGFLNLLNIFCAKRPPWYILLYDVLVTYPNFMNFGDFS